MCPIVKFGRLQILEGSTEDETLWRVGCNVAIFITVYRLPPGASVENVLTFSQKQKPLHFMVRITGYTL
jgi:hypothetical protein